MAKVLIIDDDEMYCGMLSMQIRGMGHDAAQAGNLAEGLRKVKGRNYDVVFLDVNLPDGSGLGLIPAIREVEVPPEIIIITGFGDADGAEIAIRNGAWDYINKGSSVDTVKLSLARALQYREGRMAAHQPVSLNTDGIVGISPEMKACFDLLAQAAVSEANVLIIGETGTGKELFAQAVHENSSRAKQNFVTVDCAALPESLLESVLLGHEKGAFTGADSVREGLIEQADGGTLFLDEIGELPISMQKAFLRVLQERRFRRVGGKKEITSDFRLVVATNRDLDEMVSNGDFRQDLFFRMRSLTIGLPPLRSRQDDVFPLLMYHNDRLCRRYGMEPKGISPGFIDAFKNYPWPGNVRELVNMMEGVLASAGSEPIIYCQHMPQEFRVKIARAAFPGDEKPDTIVNEAPPESIVPMELPDLKGFKKSMEKQYIQDLLVAARSNIKEACRISGLSRSRLYGLLKEYDISMPADE